MWGTYNLCYISTDYKNQQDLKVTGQWTIYTHEQTLTDELLLCPVPNRSFLLDAHVIFLGIECGRDPMSNPSGHENQPWRPVGWHAGGRPLLNASMVCDEQGKGMSQGAQRSLPRDHKPLPWGWGKASQQSWGKTSLWHVRCFLNDGQAFVRGFGRSGKAVSTKGVF